MLNIMPLKKLAVLGLWLAISMSSSVVAEQPCAHVHGHAQLHLIIEKNHINVELTARAMSLVGFEHAPHTKKEKNAIENTKQQLRQPTLFSFYEKKGFFRKKTVIKTSLVNVHADLLKDHKGHEEDVHSHTKIHTAHTEFKLNARYDKPPESTVTALATQLFSHFNLLEEVSVVIVSDTQQSHHVLSRKHPQVTIQ